MKKKKLLLLLLILLVILAGKSLLASVPTPRNPNPVLKSPRHASVQVNAVMVRGGIARAVLPLALPLPNTKLVWLSHSSQDLIVNYTVWESQDLRTWRIIGTVTAPVGTATATEFDLGFSVFQTTKPHAFWKVSSAWKV